MAKTSVITARIDPDLKQNVEHIFTELGLTTSQAITIFFKQVALQRGIPFSVRIPTPNEVTRNALEDASLRRNLDTYESAESLFEDLGI